jgi:hypothetical protein
MADANPSEFEPFHSTIEGESARPSQDTLESLYTRIASMTSPDGDSLDQSARVVCKHKGVPSIIEALQHPIPSRRDFDRGLMQVATVWVREWLAVQEKPGEIMEGYAVWSDGRNHFELDRI